MGRDQWEVEHIAGFSKNEDEGIMALAGGYVVAVVSYRKDQLIFMLAQSTRSTRFTLSCRGSELEFGVLVKQILLDQGREFLYVLTLSSLV